MRTADQGLASCPIIKVRSASIAESSSKRLQGFHFSGNPLKCERVGFYNPIAAGKDVKLQLDTERVKHWVDNGAQLTEKVKALYKAASKQAAQAA